MALSAAQEMFSLAYVGAVIAAARCASGKPEPDVVGIDLNVHQGLDGDPPGFSTLDLQLKCTYQQGAVTETHIKYKLKKAHYDALRTPRVTVPRILVVVVVPPNIEEWLHQSEEEMRILRCGYWISLRDEPATDTASKTVSIPRTNLFTVEALCNLLYEALDEDDGAA